MKLSSKGRYAVMALADLAKFDPNEPVSLRDISLRQGISLVYLEQLFLKLKKNNLVESSRGPSGGYSLAKSPEEIKLSSIIKKLNLKPKFVHKTGTGDMNLLGNQMNIPVLTYGPGNPHLSHTSNENIMIDEFLTSIDIYQNSIENIFDLLQRI